jgi:small subunit ribosomal protein S11
MSAKKFNIRRSLFKKFTTKKKNIFSYSKPDFRNKSFSNASFKRSRKPNKVKAPNIKFTLLKNKFKRNRIINKNKNKNKNKNDDSIGFVLGITQTYNNFFIIFSTLDGNTIFYLSGGHSGLRGSKRGTVRASEIVSNIFVERFENVKRLLKRSVKVSLVLRCAPSIVVTTFINNIAPFVPISAILSLVKIPHNGIRGKRLRRV